MGIIEDALTDFVVNHFEGELDEVQEVKEELQDLKSTVNDLEDKVDRLLEDDEKGGTTDASSGDDGTSQKRVSSRTLKSIRDRFDLTQKELAELLDVSSVTISSWESGDTKPQKGNKEKIVTLREKSKADVEDMLDRADEQEEKEQEESTSVDVRSIRKKHGLTQKEFAEILDVTPTTVSNWEQGQTNPSQERIEEIRNLDVSADEDEEDSGTSTSGDEIKEIRSKLDLSQSDFAEKLGVSAGTVSNWERGQSNPGSDTLEEIRDLAEQEPAEDKEEGDVLSGEDLKELRKDKDLSQSELAEKLGVSAGTISNWERGKGSVSETAREKLKNL
jgi:DNA-binding transcriptional regulator YiaG